MRNHGATFLYQPLCAKKRLAKHSTILFSTHILSEVEAVCDRALILMNGYVRADARLSELETTSDAILVLQNKVKNAEATLRGQEGVRGVESFTSHDGFPAYRVLGAPKADLTPAVYALARDNDWPVRELRRDVRTLETVFNQLATSEDDETDE